MVGGRTDSRREVLGMNEALHRQLVSGELTGWRAALGRLGLSCLACGYAAGVELRALGFRTGWLKETRVAVPVISIGNLTAGGTGKTPFAAFIARWFREHGTRVAFLSRGYGADPGAVNDEALVLNLLCPDVPHLQNPDRIAGAEIAIQELESQVLILDDGFQHRRLARNLDIVLIDATNPWGFGALLPRGFLREPLSALRRADIIVLTRVDQVSAESVHSIRQRLLKIRGTDACLEVSFPSHQLVNSRGETYSWEQIRDAATHQQRRIAAFCGIGNPAAFRQLLAQQGLKIEAETFQIFPDHHRYTREDVDRLQTWATEMQACSIVTTQKDLVKLDVAEIGGIPLWAAEITVEIHAGKEPLEERLNAIRKTIPVDEFEDWTVSTEVK
ncbi:MAG: Tetraacyldisaccharide 4-kinase [Planctomycetaceae bacterium]|nr:Tetraacyldisaccharide 4-kinase [Planctomycetaceae bacterium]